MSWYGLANRSSPCTMLAPIAPMLGHFMDLICMRMLALRELGLVVADDGRERSYTREWDWGQVYVLAHPLLSPLSRLMITPPSKHIFKITSQDGFHIAAAALNRDPQQPRRPN